MIEVKNKNILTLLLIGLLSTSCSPTKTYSVENYRTVMKFHDNFKILQLTDLHFGIESNLEEQTKFISQSIKEANPDLILLTGDNFMYASKSIVRLLVDTLNTNCKELTSSHPETVTKFAITFGNHDNQGDYPRYYINNVIKEYVTTEGKEVEDNKYASFIDYEDDDLFGLTNYYIDLVDDISKSRETVDVKYRIHIIDSNTYHYTGIKYGYDYIKEEQLEHVNNIYNNATKDKDYIGIAAFHIPLKEFQDANEQYESSTNKDNVGQGNFGEDVLYPYKDINAYQKLKEANISSFIVGHNHKIATDVIYNADSSNIEDKAIFSFGVKSTNQLYHFKDQIGYKIINLKDNMTKEEFISIENIKENFKNVTTRGEDYEK